MVETVRMQCCGDVVSAWWRREAVTRALVMCALPAVVVYGLGDLVSGLICDGYSFRDQAISELSAFGSTVRPLMASVIVVHDLLLVAFGVGVWRVASRRSLRWTGALLAATGLSGLPTHTVFAMSSRSMEVGFNDTMHQALTGVFLVLVIPAIVAAAVGYAGWFRVYSAITLAIMAGFGAAASFAIRGIEENSTAWAGGFERTNAYIYFAWLVVLAITVMRDALDHRHPDHSGAMVGASTRHTTSIPAA